jgi:ATP synthase protein I
MNPYKDLGRFGTIGIELLVSMALGYYGGRWLDEKVGGHGWVTGAGAFFGMLVGFYSMWRTTQKLERDIQRAEKKERGEGPWS